MSEGSPVTIDKEAKAAAKGLVVVRPKPEELFLDLDDEAACRVFWENLPIVDEALRLSPDPWQSNAVEGFTVAPSQSGKPWRYHAIVTLRRPVAARERVLLQAVLGSDRLHEALALREIAQGIPDATVFFERPEIPFP